MHPVVVSLFFLALLRECAGTRLRRDDLSLAQSTLTMLDLSLPPGSRWRSLVFSLGPRIVFDNEAFDTVQQTLALARFVHTLELRPTGGVDHCHALADAARRTMGVRAMDRGDTRRRAKEIRERTQLVEALCRGTDIVILNAAEERAFRDAKFILSFG